MTIDKSFKVGIITSLIGSVVFLYLLDPILRILSDLFFLFSNKVSSYFVDNLYKEIAIGKTDYSLTQMVIFTLIISSLFSLMILRKTIRKTRKSNVAKEQDLKKLPENTDKSIKKAVWRVKIFPIAAVIIINMLMALQLVSSHIKVSSINTFDQRIRILAPYLNENQKLLLISRFSSMKTYDDYQKIMLDTEIIAKNNKIILPEQIYTYTY